MDKKELLQKAACQTGVTFETAEKVYNAITEILSETLGHGEKLDLRPELGTFIPKEWDNPGRNSNSPRSPRQACYKIRFNPGLSLEKKLKRNPNFMTDCEESMIQD